MKLKIRDRGYLLLPGIVIVFSFILVAFFISSALNRSAERIGQSLSTNVQTQKEDFFKVRFGELMGKAVLVQQILETPSVAHSMSEQMRILRTVFFSDSMINHAWFAMVSARDTQVMSVNRSDATSETVDDLSVLRKKAAFLFSAPGNEFSWLYEENGCIHWAYGRRFKSGVNIKGWAGFDINMQELRKYLEKADPKGQSYAFITDRKGLCIYNPDEKLIGKTILSRKIASIQFDEGSRKKEVMRDTVLSDYLKVPVIRYYSPFRAGSEQWVLIVDTPMLLFEDEVNAISRYSAVLGTIAVLIILSVGAYSQRKWFRELMRRQEAENEQKMLMLEKQHLLISAEKQQKENALLQLDKLKEKINPHFLFNSLGSLNALISQDTSTAKEFVLKLSKVYRYVLNDVPSSLAMTKEEISFAEQYSFLLKIRFGDALAPLQTDVSQDNLEKYLPFMSIQTAVENAVKHNVLSKERPLNISIKSSGDFIIVTNNLQLKKQASETSGQGLRYIGSIYRYYGKEGFRYGEENGYFICYFPLLRQTDLKTV